MAEQFALANRVSLLLDSSLKDFTREDFIKIIFERRIERITFHYVSIDGKLKELKVPVGNRIQIDRTLADGELVDGSPLFKGMVDTTLSDLYVVPVYKSSFLNPFDQQSLDFICRYLDPDGKRTPFAPDYILHKANKIF